MRDLTSNLLRGLRARPRLTLSAAAGALVALVLPHLIDGRDVTHWLIGWNVGVWAYLALTGVMMARSSREDMRRRALDQDDGAITILMLVVMAALASLGAIVAELAVARSEAGLTRHLHVALAALTIVSSWAFAQVMFALHYAHDYYQSRHDGQPGGLIFPDTPQPDYLDFLYVAVVIGTSAQTADVAFGSPAMRRVGLVHCVLAFLFNATLLALMVNVGANLI
ncbi:MAG: DUF1345 domain-containing protein [Burkholderiales bacterium]|nr:DUF1345 domain-containing protein [Burkholderiales bacterium]